MFTGNLKKKVNKKTKLIEVQVQVSRQTASDCLSPGRLFVSDAASGWHFLIDTGSNLCCFLKGRFTPADFDFIATNRGFIKFYDTITLRLNLGLHQNLRWTFLSSTSTRLIGLDFLEF